MMMTSYTAKRTDGRTDGLPMRGMEEAAGGVDSASRSNKTKKATKIFIPGTK